MKPFLILGYGNPDRQDDGVAWHILGTLIQKLGLPSPASYMDLFPVHEAVDFAFHLQLTPEMAEDVHIYQYVCFVDAHTGSIPESVRLIPVASEFQASPFTHHLTPQSLLSICETLYGYSPEAALLSVRGYHFGLSQQLSEATAALVPLAIERICDWMNARDPLHPQEN